MPCLTYSRVDLALEQLEVALSLFLDQRRYAATITLAGAAEEVFGRELARRGGQSVLDWKFDHMGLFHKLLHGKDLRRKDFAADENYMRNALKHFGDTDDPNLTVDLQDAACWMLVRSCENAQRLNLAILRFEEFDSWFYEHVVGV